MKDIHNHLLYGIDDGAKTIDDSIAIARELVKNGVTDAILTPHYITGSSYSYNNKEKQERLNNLKVKLEEEKIPLNLYLGNEVFIDLGLVDKMKDGSIRTLNNSRYLLVEFSLTNKLRIDREILFELRALGCVPILAHPERYKQYFKDFEFFNELIRMGILLQGNLKSLVGHYGKDAKEMLEELLKRNMIHFMATDIHRVQDMSYVGTTIEMLSKIVGKEMTKELTDTNIGLVIEDLKIVPYEIKEPRRENLISRMRANFKIGGDS